MHSYPLMTSPSSNRRHYAVPILQAAEDAPTLAKLARLARESGERLLAVESLIPHSLRSAVRPGPIDGTEWCLLVDSSAAAAKMRQVLPTLKAHLCSRGCEVNSIRLKVQIVGK
jgi:hypothetical protein